MSKPMSSPAERDAPREYRKPRADVYTVLLVIALVIPVIGSTSLG